jgi:hypothetical protein
MSSSIPENGFKATYLYVPKGIEPPSETCCVRCPLIRSIADLTQYFAVLTDKAVPYGGNKTYHLHHNHDGYFLRVYQQESNTSKWENLKGLDEYDDHTLVIISLDMDGNLGIVKEEL